MHAALGALAGALDDSLRPLDPLEGARALIEQSLAPWQDAGDAWGTATACGLRGLARVRRARCRALRRAEPHAYEDVGDRSEVARCRGRLGCLPVAEMHPVDHALDTLDVERVAASLLLLC